MRAYYAIVKQKNRVIELRHENAAGQLISHTYGPFDDILNRDTCRALRPAHARYDYAADGTLSRAIFYSRDDSPALVLNYDSVNSVKVTAYENLLFFGALWEYPQFVAHCEAGICYEILYDENGYTEEVRYRDASSQSLLSLKIDADEIGGLRFQRDSLGRVTQIDYTYGYASGQDMSLFTFRQVHSRNAEILPRHSEDIWQVTCQYDDSGNLDEIRYRGSDGGLILSESGYAIRRITYDADHNVLELRFFGIDEAPTGMDNGTASVVPHYDERHRLVSMERLDENGTVLSQALYREDGSLRPDYSGLG